MKILFATDGSVNADNAVQSILEKEWPEGTSCRVVTVAEPLHRRLNAALFGIGDLARAAQSDLENDLETLLQECVSKLAPKFGQANVSSELIKGNPKHELVQAAKNWHSDLIIIGSHGDNPDDHWFSSVTRALVANAPCSVQVLNPQTSVSLEKKEQEDGTVKPKPSRYLVAISDEHNAKAIINSIIERPWPEASLFQIISVVHVSKPLQSRFFKSKDIEELRQQSLNAHRTVSENLIKEAAHELETKFPTSQVTFHVLEGSPRNMILQIAQDWPADMIILGSHEQDHGALEHFLGSTAAAVVWNAECSVELVKLQKVSART